MANLDRNSLDTQTAKQTRNLAPDKNEQDLAATIFCASHAMTGANFDMRYQALAPIAVIARFYTFWHILHA
jgi:hypothetical protein